ncbi:GGDEF domain-containing protein [Antrihabitans cavernicola]|uniref:GGDEF domain-containing protein n=1 Tax=Antrihabitans cavernicola TaxID=2495913 RepID=A0A5A7S7X3_9NOCA|nr:GGDEF domain-containing protein [Spelaeibacter cavernicola]KAA0019480.1 GGDEF domain-containing protein [Spelaeibacter cavernicola]
MTNESRYAHTAFGVFAGLALAILMIAGTPDVTLVVLLVLGISVAGAVVYGVRKFRPRSITTWFLPLVAIAFFFVGDAVRRSSGYADLSGSIVPDLFTLSAYAALLIATVKYLHPRSILGGNIDAYLDLASVVVSGVLVSWTLLVTPALRSPQWPSGAKATIVALYPMLDVILLVLLVYSLSTSGPAGRALRLVQLSIGTVVAGNLAISATAAGIVDLPDRALVVPYVVAIVAFGIAALQPSMAEIGARPAIDPDKLRQRALVISVTMLAGALVAIIGGSNESADSLMTGPWLTVLILLVLLRSERAILRSKRNERRAVERADRDPLTGLPNRTVLMRELDAMSSEEPRCVMFIDLNGFKSVNDLYGHDVGDELLKIAGHRIRAAIRIHDVVARFGGDEFVVVTREGREQVMPFAQRLAHVIDEPFQLGVGPLKISASIGIATADGREGGIDSDTLLRRADLAMYQAKDFGKGMIVFFDQLEFSERELRRRPVESTRGLAFDSDAAKATAEEVSSDDSDPTLQRDGIDRNDFRRIQ